ncbi:hypothetical protein NE237_001167 [Protea cynaroides]|uniref:O-fucosyltransferase family protein n=1 Tax=Protea cynaroides TaxID=273540 RepID=A0A9Q0KST1_9MAGN|nr:hypothetical protein NE237_001167 [Protea cynaroides]
MWGEPYKQSSAWKPCADKTSTIHKGEHFESTGFILVSANGGLNQQRVSRLRCKCNFHALKFVPKIQEAGSLLVRRLWKYDLASSQIDKQLLGNFIPNNPSKQKQPSKARSKYLALHLRFEIDMVAYSLCEFGGGENERQELHAYRESHFPLLIERLKKTKLLSPAELRKLGRCPLTPEEAALVLSGLGFRRDTYMYLAGSHIYGGQSRMQPFIDLYSNFITKEDLHTPHELAPFSNFSSQGASFHFLCLDTEFIMVGVVLQPCSLARRG